MRFYYIVFLYTSHSTIHIIIHKPKYIGLKKNKKIKKKPKYIKESNIKDDGMAKQQTPPLLDVAKNN